MPLIHKIEDLQFICFAIVFGITVWQSRGKHKTTLYVWCSYLLATTVAVVDGFVAQPLSLFANAVILSILSLRYAVLAAGVASFTGHARWLSRSCYVLFAVACGLLAVARFHVQPPRLLALYFTLMALQLIAIALILLRSTEASTRVPRYLLGLLFFLSAAYRVNQMLFVLSQKTPHDVWRRDQGLFLNSTILGCLLPFTIVWMMNARDHATLLAQSLLDPLTNLLNRRGLAEAGNRELIRYSREQRDFAVAVADLDRFKLLNDTYGHSVGDAVLQWMAEMIRELVRAGDVVARTGGEEFVILLPLTDEAEMLPALERLRSKVEAAEFRGDGGLSLRVTISIGVANTRGRGDITWAELEREADTALYDAKRAGRNLVMAAER